MIKDAFMKQATATQTDEDLAALIQKTSRDICEKELLAEISAIQSAYRIVDSIDRVNNFNDEKVAKAFLEKIESFIVSNKKHSELLRLKEYFVDPETSPINLWELWQYSDLQVEITSQLMKTCVQISELDRLFHDSPMFIFEQTIPVFFERRQHLEKFDR